MSRPQRPEILSGSIVPFWVFADRIETGLRTLRKFLQQQCWPHRS